jgi:hypothetical protein
VDSRSEEKKAVSRPVLARRACDRSGTRNGGQNDACCNTVGCTRAGGKTGRKKTGSQEKAALSHLFLLSGRASIIVRLSFLSHNF